MPSETHIEARVKSLNAVLTEKHGQAVGKALRAANGDMPAALTSLKGKLPGAALQKVALAHTLAVWSDNHVSVVKALSSMRKSRTSGMWHCGTIGDRPRIFLQR